MADEIQAGPESEVKGDPHGKPRAGHKYVKRWWDYDSLSWKYEYAQSPHDKKVESEAPLVSPDDDYHTTSFKLAEDDPADVDPETKYRAHQADFLFKEGDHPVELPKIGKFSIRVKADGDKFRYTAVKEYKDEKGRTIENKIGPFKDFGDLELELIREEKSERFYDANGDMIAQIVPQIGTVTTPEIVRRVKIDKDRSTATNKKVEGALNELIPSERPGIKPVWDTVNRDIEYYKVQFADKYAGSARKSKKGTSLRFSTKKGALKAIAFTTNVPIESPTEANKRTFSPVDYILRTNLWSNYEVNPNYTKDGSGRKYHRELKVDPKIKNILINTVANDLRKLIWTVARKFALSTPAQNIYPGGGPESVSEMTADLITGGDEQGYVPDPTVFSQAEAAGKPVKTVLTPASPVYRVIEHVIDTYGLDGRSIFQRLAGKYRYNSKGNIELYGELRYAFHRHLKDLLGSDGMPISFSQFTEEKGYESAIDDYAVDTEHDYIGDLAYGEDQTPEDQAIEITDNIDDKEYYQESHSPGTRVPSAELEDFSDVQVEWNSPSVAEWVNSQLESLNDVQDSSQDEEKSALAEQFYQVLYNARRERKLQDVVPKLQQVMSKMDMNDYYVPFLPFVQQQAIKKAVDAIKIDMLKAVSNRYRSIPEVNTNPEYFNPEGKLLFRAPPDNVNVMWNTGYNKDNPRNMWAGKWFNPNTSGDEYTYLSEDIEGNEKLSLHTSLLHFSAKIKELRKEIQRLIGSSSVKDRTTGLILLMLDQGRYDLEYLLSLLPQEVEPVEPLTKLGYKTLYLDARTIDLLVEILGRAIPEVPIFHLPVKNDSDYRFIGVEYISKVLESLGVSYRDLRLYVINKAFYLKLNRLLKQGLGYNQAVNGAAIHALKEMYPLENQEVGQEDIVVFMSTFIDPILQKHLYNKLLLENAPMDSDQEAEIRDSVPIVRANLEDLDPDEQEIAKLLYSLDIHNLL